VIPVRPAETEGASACLRYALHCGQDKYAEEAKVQSVADNTNNAGLLR
jgi:hypothetical protein